MRWFIGIFVAVCVIGLGWLWLSPPTVTVVGVDSPYTCPSLAPWDHGTVSVDGHVLDEAADVVTESLRAAVSSDTVDVTPEMVADGKNLLAEGCSSARTDRQTAVLLGAVTGATITLAAVIMLRTRRRSTAEPTTASADLD